MRVPPVEIVDDDISAPDRVLIWLGLGLGDVYYNHGEQLFRLGVPCRRRMIRAPITKSVFVDDEDGDGEEAVWGGDTADIATGVAGDRVEEREVAPAQYAYECPRVFIPLTAEQARWAYETFKAAEFDSMYRLRDNLPWQTYVEELRDGMEKT